MLTILAIIVAIFALVQLIRVFELTNKLRGDDQSDVEFAENRMRARLWLVFGAGYFAFFAWLASAYGEHMLPEAASEHGATIDDVMAFNWIIIISVFVITHVLLFFYASKYYWRPGTKADFITHNNKLELLWTSVPAIVLFVIIIYGLSAWNNIMEDAPEESIKIELYSKQFDWTARYAGQDGVLGNANVNFINATNPLGLITPSTINERVAELEAQIADLEAALEKAPKGGKKEHELMEKLDHKNRQISQIYVHEYKMNEDNTSYVGGEDDKLVKVEFHVPVGKPVAFEFRSQDVIHSAYMPHFRAQMNTVPGQKTTFHFTPTITTEEMRQKTGNSEFNYLLLCNKICGAAHYNMQMNIIVESEAEYERWLGEQKTFAAVPSTQNVELAQNAQ